MRKHFLAVTFWKQKVAATAKICSYSQEHQNADIAQLVEQVIRNDQVVGSNPTIGSSSRVDPKGSFSSRHSGLPQYNNLPDCY